MRKFIKRGVKWKVVKEQDLKFARDFNPEFPFIGSGYE